MRIYNPQNGKALDKELIKILQAFRAKRQFDPEKYLIQKSALLNMYMADFKLKSCVIAVSGGVDSAVVLGIVHNASQQKNSPIKKNTLK